MVKFNTIQWAQRIYQPRELFFVFIYYSFYMYVRFHILSAADLINADYAPAKKNNAFHYSFIATGHMCEWKIVNYTGRQCCLFLFYFFPQLKCIRRLYILSFSPIYDIYRIDYIHSEFPLIIFFSERVFAIFELKQKLKAIMPISFFGETYRNIWNVFSCFYYKTNILFFFFAIVII